MSNVYIHRLERVQQEYEATRSALEYVQRNWQKQSVFLDISNSTPEDFRRTTRNIDTVFVVRLFSVFEGILKEHLAEYHSSLSIPEDARAVFPGSPAWPRAAKLPF